MCRMGFCDCEGPLGGKCGGWEGPATRDTGFISPATYLIEGDIIQRPFPVVDSCSIHIPLHLYTS